MRIEHLAVWTSTVDRLERTRAFYATYFGAVAGPRYASARRPGFSSCFLTFPPVDGASGGGTRLELMTAPDLATAMEGEVTGYAHLALAVGARRGGRARRPAPG